MSIIHRATMQTHYERLGGEAKLRELVNRFYDLMDEDPDYYGIRKLHPRDLTGSREKLFMFLSGWMGGPPLYVEAFGHPRLRARHLPFPIGVAERDEWLACMVRAMEEVGVEEKLRRELAQAFARTADHMRNVPG
ncbi:MAG: group II truncated hemoglobin [Burkholderiales bacterium]